MRTLTLSNGSFDQTNTFGVAHPHAGGLPIKAALHIDYQSVNDGIYWAMQKGPCVKSSYTDADRAETARLQSEPAIQNGEVVLIGGKQYKCRVLGDYSDCAIFDAI